MSLEVVCVGAGDDSRELVKQREKTRGNTQVTKNKTTTTTTKRESERGEKKLRSKSVRNPAVAPTYFTDSENESKTKGENRAVLRGW